MFKKPFPFIITLLLLLFAFVCFMPLIITKSSWLSLGVDKPNEIGDTIGGIMGPLVGFIGAIAAFLAFWIQFKANQKQFLQFDKQDVDTTVQRFENRFYELLKIHRDNVQEFEIITMLESESNLTGKKVFGFMIDELKLSFQIVDLSYRKLITQEKISKVENEIDYIFKLAYFFFFEGIQKDEHLDYRVPSKKERYKTLGFNYDILIPDVEKIIIEVRNEYKKNISKNNLDNLYYHKYDFGTNMRTTPHLRLPDLKYLPFSGHASKLGHYFRHLFQTVKYVIKQDIKTLKNTRYDYTRIIRAQLSNYEQVLLYYNSISYYGKPWLGDKGNDNYLADWRMVKNIPLYVANFGPLPKDILGIINKNGEMIFEVDEIAERAIE